MRSHNNLSISCDSIFQRAESASRRKISCSQFAHLADLGRPGRNQSRLVWANARDRIQLILQASPPACRLGFDFREKSGPRDVQGVCTAPSLPTDSVRDWS